MKQIPNLFGIVILFLALIVSEVNSEVSKEVSNTSNYDESRLLLLGFGDFYTGDQYANFLVFFKEYENQLIPVNSEPKYTSFCYIYLNESNITFEVEAEYKANINNSQVQNTTFECKFEGKANNNLYFSYMCFNYNFTNEIKENLNYTKITKFPTEIGEIPIIQSSYASKTIKEKNLLDFKGGVNIYEFDYISPEYKLDNITLKGNISNIFSAGNTTEMNLILNDKVYNCTIYELKNNANTTHAISFAPDNLLNEDLTYNVLYTNNGKAIMLIDTEKAAYKNITYNRDDYYYVYQKEEGNTTNSYLELIGFGNFTKKSTSGDATGKAYFRGAYNYLKSLPKYIRFFAKVMYSSSALRILQTKVNTYNSTVIGVKDIDKISKGLVTYNLTYEGTEKLNIINASLTSKFQFSDSTDFTNATSPQVSIDDKTDLDLANSDPIEFKTMRLKSDKLFFEGNTGFNFLFEPDEKIKFDDNIAKLVLNNSENDSSLEAYTCALSRNTSEIYNISCEPKKSIRSLVNTWKIIITDSDSTKRLRSLSDSEQIFYMDEKSDKELVYNHITRSGKDFRIPSDGRLSGGAIAGIVIGTVAVVGALGVTIFMVNRVHPVPGKPGENVAIPNSSSHINA